MPTARAEQETQRHFHHNKSYSPIHSQMFNWSEPTISFTDIQVMLPSISIQHAIPSYSFQSFKVISATYVHVWTSSSSPRTEKKPCSLWSVKGKCSILSVKSTRLQSTVSSMKQKLALHGQTMGSELVFRRIHCSPNTYMEITRSTSILAGDHFIHITVSAFLLYFHYRERLQCDMNVEVHAPMKLFSLVVSKAHIGCHPPVLDFKRRSHKQPTP